MILSDQFRRYKDAFRMGMGVQLKELLNIPNTVQGVVHLEMRDARSGELICERTQKNVITLDAGIQVARLLKNPLEPAHGLNMLAVGTGATGALLSPNAPDNRQRKLNAEIARKPFSSTQFRDASGNAVAYPTNVVDFTTTFGEGEAVGPLNEMSLLSTISANPAVRNPNPNSYPTRDVTVNLANYDVALNYYTMPVMSKQSPYILTVTWRLTF